MPEIQNYIELLYVTHADDDLIFDSCRKGTHKTTQYGCDSMLGCDLDLVPCAFKLGKIFLCKAYVQDRHAVCQYHAVPIHCTGTFLLLWHEINEACPTSKTQRGIKPMRIGP